MNSTVGRQRRWTRLPRPDNHGSAGIGRNQSPTTVHWHTRRLCRQAAADGTAIRLPRVLSVWAARVNSANGCDANGVAERVELRMRPSGADRERAAYRLQNEHAGRGYSDPPACTSAPMLHSRFPSGSSSGTWPSIEHAADIAALPVPEFVPGQSGSGIGPYITQLTRRGIGQVCD